MKIDTQAQVDAAERTLRLVWAIVGGAVLFSILTVTPLVERVTPDEWDWTAPILPLVVDAAVIIVVRVDTIVARLDGDAGAWPMVLRWLTGAMTLLLNIGDSALTGDMVGVGVHMVAPTLLIVTAEASLKWRRAIAVATARIERERADERERRARERQEQQDRSRADREAREKAQADERERARQAEDRRREQEQTDREREREHKARLERERLDHEARMAREERDHVADVERERRAEEAKRHKEEADRADRARRDEQQRLDRERTAREAIQRTERDRKAAEARRTAPAPVSAAVSAPRPAVSATVSTPAHETAHDAPAVKKMSETEALAAVAEAIREGRSQRQVVALTGWSTGWIAKQFKELTPQQTVEQMEMSA
ncbi:hypothetical protein GCM10010260_83920 [Streptomyces filipinensis]|uniref:SpdB n=1 Tax=Streptomyces filipinensis TaxID=66887 RepID=A0A918MGP1_9ACTN|nr:DUF2637 domain-containing protein [Streptomyces filipinensis]GGV30726.1 hypothetical protein GCM10010260_83920 [Streptomyces filipinensis]